jgi:hypothetical protein
VIVLVLHVAGVLRFPQHANERGHKSNAAMR